MIVILCIILLCVFVVWMLCARKKRERFSRDVLGNYILLKLITPNKTDMGGFAFHLHMVQCGIWFAEMNDKKLYVYFNKGYYHDKKMGDNWWEHYFKQPYDFSEDEVEMILYAMKKNKMKSGIQAFLWLLCIFLVLKYMIQ